MERSGVGYQRRVNAFGNLFSDSHAGGFAEVVDHLADGRRSGIDPIDTAEESGGGVVIDVNHELLFEIGEARPGNVGTLDHEHRMISRIYSRSDAYIIGS